MTLLGMLTGALVLVGAGCARRPPRSRWHPEGRPPPRAAPPRRRRSGPHPASTLPEVVDLLAVAASAGLPVSAAVAAVTPWAPEPWRAGLTAAMEAGAAGWLLHDALGHLDAVGAGTAAPLVAVLRAGLADGDGVVDGLARLATDARDLRRRRAEEQARAMPVRLLLPLVGCSLPAFVVLTIVPILAGALQGLRLPDPP